MAISAKQQLREWINGKRNYAEGIKLYAKFGTVHALKQLFTAQHSHLLENKLYDVNLDLFHSLPQEDIIPVIKVETSKVVDALVSIQNSVTELANQSAGIPSAQLYEQDEAFKTKKEEALLLFKQQSDLHASLDHIKSESQRLKVCCDILEIVEKLTKMWDALDYYREHRKFPEEIKPKEIPGLEELTEAQLIKRQNNLRPRLSKEKNKHGEDSEKYKQLKSELTAIEEKLKSYAAI